MVSITLNPQSLRAFEQYLDQIGRDALDIVRAEIEDSMLSIEAKAAENVPVDTGNLKNSIQSMPITSNSDNISGGVYVGANYAAFVEFGTRYMPAQPFFYPEVYRQDTQLKRNIERSLRILFNR